MQMLLPSHHLPGPQFPHMEKGEIGPRDFKGPSISESEVLLTWSAYICFGAISRRQRSAQDHPSSLSPDARCPTFSPVAHIYRLAPQS